MIAVIATIVIGIDPTAFYTPYQSPHASPAATDFYTPYQAPAVTEPEKEAPPEPKEEPKNVEVSRRRVDVYLDLRDVASVRKVVDGLDDVQGLEFFIKDKSDLPGEARSLALPVFHLSTGPGTWGFKSGWDGPAKFAEYWRRYNKNEDVPERQSQARSPRPQRSSGYRAHSYEWHITRGESVATLRSHLATPSSEHHGVSFDRAWLDTLSRTELVGLHSDAHNGRVQWDQVPQKLTKDQKALGRVLYGTRDGKHPGKVGGSIRGFFGDPRYQYMCPSGNCSWSRG